MTFILTLEIFSKFSWKESLEGNLVMQIPLQIHFSLMILRENPRIIPAQFGDEGGVTVVIGFWFLLSDT